MGCAPRSFARLRNSGSRRGLDGLPGEIGDLVAHLRALADPEIQAFGVQSDRLLGARRDRVVVTQALDVAAVARAAAVGDDDVVEGALLRAAAGKANLDHGARFLCSPVGGRA